MNDDIPNGPEPDERRVAHILRARGVGPDAFRGPVRLLAPAPAEPEPDPGPDWLDRLWDAMDADERQPAVAHPRGGARMPEWWADKAPLGPGPGARESGEDLVPLLDTGRDPAPASEPDAPAPVGAPAPDAPASEPPVSGWWQAHPGYWPHPHWPAVPQPVQQVALAPRTRAFLYTASAAGTGYALGLAPQLSTWLRECGTQAGIPAALVLGIGGCIAVAHMWDRRTRHWWPGLAWAARIPLASALLALGLYAPGAH